MSMSSIAEFFQTAFTMPTLVWSVLLVLVIVYWSISLLGVFDLGMLEGLGEIADVADAADAAEGLLEETPGFFDKLGFGDVPRVVTWSLVVVFGWVFSYGLNVFFPQVRELATRGLVLALGVGGFALVLGIGATALAIQPLRKLAEANAGLVREELVGRLCTVKTGRVDSRFGQAEVDDGAMLVQVRAAEPNFFQRGMKALICEYDRQREVFLIAPYEEKSS
jgi:hypothetical protein